MFPSRLSEQEWDEMCDGMCEESVCVCGPSHGGVRSTNEEPSRRPCPNMGDGVLGAKDAHWLKMNPWRR